MEFLKKRFDLNGIALVILAIFACFAVWGGIVYKLYSLNRTGVTLAAILSLASAALLIRYAPPRVQAVSAEGGGQRAAYRKPLALVYLALVSAAFFILLSSATDRAIVSPWQVVPRYFFLVYFLSTCCLAVLSATAGRFFLILTSLHYLLSFSVIIIVYQLGFGFDSFVHQATLELIDKQGVVEPRPMYYLGYYGLVMILHKLTFVPIAWINRLLLPVLAALSLPAIISKIEERWIGGSAALTAVLPLVIPLSMFTFSTPQNLGYLLLLTVVLLALVCGSLFELSLIYLFSAAALVVQPLAGLPAVIFSALLTIYHSDSLTARRKNIGYFLVSAFCVISLPALFYFLDGVKNLSWSNLISNLAAAAPTALTLAGQENLYLNFAYLYGFNLPLLLLLVVLAGLIVYRRSRGALGVMKIYLLLAAALAAAAAITLVVPFSFLIDYERGDYARRILIESLIMLSPFILLALASFARRIGFRGAREKFIWLFFFAGLVTASLYIAYPRIDNYYNSRGYSTGRADVEAVDWINADAAGDYVVLSQQQVSAAALMRFGFLKYYRNDLFYYPIPTSSPLYAYYLDMVYKKPDKQTMDSAMELAGVNQAYFVLNKYWWAFPKILDEAKFSADSWKSFSDGQVYVFKFKR